LSCRKCSHWKCEELTLNVAKDIWSRCLGGQMTPGIIRRYEKRGTEARIGYKYCAEGILTRFYIMKGSEDRRPVKDMEGCPKFSESSYTKPSETLWAICATETHGPSVVKGIRFTPGLYENNTYMRIPLYDSVRPTVEKGDALCSTCGKEMKKSIRILIERSFCCNKHYLEWWAQRYTEECQKL
jgi:hypothetical protein